MKCSICDPMIRARSILKDVFGFETFWPLQEKIIAHILEKKDALVVMPTGGGKSLCYQIPGMIFDGLTIVVSPLISLMKDQVDQLREYGVPALFLNSSLSMEEYRANVSEAQGKGREAPLPGPGGAAGAADPCPARRPEGGLHRHRRGALHLPVGSRLPSGIPATGGGPRRLSRCGLRGADGHGHAACPGGYPAIPEYRRPQCQFIGSFNRPNLFLEVAPKTEPLDQVLALLEQYPERIGHHLLRHPPPDGRASRRSWNERAIPSGPTMRGCRKRSAPRTRSASAATISGSSWRRSPSAWGSTSPMSGSSSTTTCPGASTTTTRRSAGRGGTVLPAHCLLLFGYGDLQKIQYFIGQKAEQEQRVANILLSQLLGFAETDLCRRVPLLNYFGETGVPERCGDVRQLPDGERGKGARRSHHPGADVPLLRQTDRARSSARAISSMSCGARIPRRS